MRKSTYIYFILCFSLGMVQTPQSDEKPQPGEQVLIQSQSQGTYNYLLYLPSDYDSQKSKWPLIMFLHGGRPEGSYYTIKTQGPSQIVTNKYLLKTIFDDSFEFVLVSPQINWESSPPDEIVQRLVDLLKEVSERYRIDKSRLYLTGASNGGIATWGIASEYPDLFAAIAPVAGPGFKYAKPEALVNIPIWAFHGENDPVFPVKDHQSTINAVQSLGGIVSFTIYPEKKHNIWDQTYRNPDLYKWFLKHKNSAVSVCKNRLRYQ